VPGLIVMGISDMGTLEDLDPNYERVVVLFNASSEEVSYTVDELARLELVLHPVQAASADAIVQTSSFEPLTGTFTVPAMTTAVFVLPECCQQ
jgi:pullulanase